MKSSGTFKHSSIRWDAGLIFGIGSGLMSCLCGTLLAKLGKTKAACRLLAAVLMFAMLLFFRIGDQTKTI